MTLRHEDYAGYDTRAHALVTSDHCPTCPRCGDLCGKLARVCASCGARLVLNEDDRRTLGLAATDAATRETGK